MAVHTKLSKANIIKILQNYTLGHLSDFKGIKEGIENTNYLVITNTNKLIITIFEKRVDTSRIPFYFDVMLNSQSKGIECPVPIKDNNGKYLNIIKDKKMAVFVFLHGSSKTNWSKIHCYKVGEKLANFHIANINNKIIVKNNFGLEYWKNIFKKSLRSTYNMIPNSFNIIKKEMNFIESNWPKDLPKGIIHADLFPDNVFFNRNNVSGFLDFYFSCMDFLSYDLAITINAWCFKNSEFNKKFFNNIISGYQSVRKLESKEKKNINILLRGAALRFLFTRIQDSINTKETKFLRKKDPHEFFDILNFHININSERFYFE